MTNHSLSAEKLNQWLHTDNPPLLVDMSGIHAYNSTHALGAVPVLDKHQLNALLASKPNQPIVVYCKYGMQSALLSHHRNLFYIPGGIKALNQQRGQNAIPIVINVSTSYGDYLLRYKHFHTFDASQADAVKRYQLLLTQGITPLMHHTIANDAIAPILSKLGVNQFIYFSTQNDPPHSDYTLMPIYAFLLIALYFIRRREFYRSLVSAPVRRYQLTSVILCAGATLLLIPAVLSYPLPFDMNLYVLSIQLPMNRCYLLVCYLLWSVCFIGNFLFNRTTRLTLLRNQLIKQTPSAKQTGKPSLRSALKGLLLTSLALYLFYTFEIPPQMMLLLSSLLLLPLLVDVLLYWFEMVPLTRTADYALTLLKKCGVAYASSSNAVMRYDTLKPEAVGQIQLSRAGQTLAVGLFSGTPLDTDASNMAYLSQDCQLIRHLLLLFQQDLQLGFDSEHKLISIQLYNNQNCPRAISRHVVLSHFQVAPGAVEEQRFTSLPFEDVFDKPTPLMVDILNKRGQPEGGYFRALRQLMVYFSATSNDAAQQFMALSNRIYVDKASIASHPKWIPGSVGVTASCASNTKTSKLVSFVSNKIANLACNLALDQVNYDYYALILPRTRLRLERLKQQLHKPMTANQLRRTSIRALTNLYTHSAKWQCYSSLLHQYAYNLLNQEASASITRVPPDFSSSPLYSLLAIETNTDFCTLKPSASETAFWAAESFRSHMSNLQLQEWRIISLLLEKLRTQLNLPHSLAYLTLDDIRSLSNQHETMVALLNTRYQQWQWQNHLRFATQFSFRDLEQISDSEALKQPQQEDNQPMHSQRVAGNQTKVVGTVVLFNPELVLQQLSQDSILVATNLSPAQLIAAQSIRAIILQQGSALGHTAIIAREKNIPLIICYPIANLTSQAKLLIEGAEIRQLTTQQLAWSLLEPDNACDELGNKAQRLRILMQQGFNVPFAVVIKHQSVKRIYQLMQDPTSQQQHRQEYQQFQADLQQLFQCFEQSPNGLIIRSSSNREDSSDFSYAGLFYSHRLNQADELLQHIHLAWQHALEQAMLLKSYPKEALGLLDALQLNLVLQHYIHGEYGGVLFTSSDRAGHMQVEISSWGAEGVTQGNHVLASLLIDENGEPSSIVGNMNLLTHAELNTLFKVGRAIETIFGCAQDIEWILSKHQIYIIQSRDLTHLASINTMQSV